MSGLQGTETSGAIAAIATALGKLAVHDVSPVLCGDLPMWFMYEPPVVNPIVRHDQGGAAVNTLALCEHTGTHVDAPFHFSATGATMTDVPVDSPLLRRFCKYDLTANDHQPGDLIGLEHLRAAEAKGGFSVQPGDVAIIEVGRDRCLPDGSDAREPTWWGRNQPGLSEEACEYVADLGPVAVASGTRLRRRRRRRGDAGRARPRPCVPPARDPHRRGPPRTRGGAVDRALPRAAAQDRRRHRLARTRRAADGVAMRLVSFRTAEGPRIGVRANGGVVDLSSVDAGLPTDMTAFLARGEDALSVARTASESGDGIAPDDVRLLPVVARPPKILCIARNYGEHAREAGLDVLEQPNIFIRFAQSLIADGEPIQVPRVSDKVDWEAELAVVMGRGGKHISQEDALDHVAGYTIFNDVSIRDWQLKKPPIQFGAGKNFDASGPLGPDLVTSDEVGDPGDLKLELSVNGETRQSGSTSEMIFSVPELIEFISKFTTLEPGDVIATGTPSGVGHFHDPPTYLKAGDTVRIEIESVGVQENPVIDEPAP